MIPKSVCPLWHADIPSDPCRKARQSAVSYTTPVDTIAEETGQIVKIDCMYCRITHRYRCRDLLQLCGDVAIDEIACHFRCEKCNHKDYLRAVFELPWGADIGKLRIRKLVRIKTVRKPVWKDDVF